MRQYAQLIIKMSVVELPELGHPVLLGQNPENGTFSIEKFLLLVHLTHKRRVAVHSVQIRHFDFQILHYITGITLRGNKIVLYHENCRICFVL